MTTNILSIFTRTPLHVGAGSSIGAIDQPVIRERHTGFPIIPGSSLKGVLRAHLQVSDNDRDFGDKTMGYSGNLSFGEGRILLFPVRSAKGNFAFITCPLALSRYSRDTGLGYSIPSVEDGTSFAGDIVLIGNKIVVEEYCFVKKDVFPQDWETHFVGLLEDSVLKQAKGRLVLLSDGDFAHFVVNACQINQHVAIDPETGVAKPRALFNEETVPSESLFYSPIVQMRDGESATLTALNGSQIIQIGGNGTTGLGFCSVKLTQNSYQL